MTSTPRDWDVDDFTAAVRQALRLVCVGLPHLSGLAHTVRIAQDARVATAGVFSSGRMLINPHWFSQLSAPERAFVIAHELLHLALGSHQRGVGTDADRFNLAHDLVINDILEQELGMPPPGGGVRLPGARHRSVEHLMMSEDLPEGQPFGREGYRPGSQGQVTTSVGAALTAALGAPGAETGDFEVSEADHETEPADLLPDHLERSWFPHEDEHQRSEACETIAREAAHAVATQLVHRTTGQALDESVRLALGTGPGQVSRGESAYVDALISAYRPPWELAVHRWIDTVSEPRRTYSRASRRAGDRTDVCLPGRTRDGRTLSLILDTSGSMTDDIAHALGAIMTFGRGAQIPTVRLVQCDTEVTADDIVDIENLSSYEISGFGGSDMTPAMHHLARDPDVEAVIVITDGHIVFPDESMPYDVLWVVYPDLFSDFDPPYGQVVPVHTDGWRWHEPAPTRSDTTQWDADL